ncbi:MAG: hypothetical protein AB7U83_18050 [Vicinamibacterales bacterium]
MAASVDRPVDNGGLPADSPARAPRGHDIVLAALGFAALTVAATWPLVRHLGTSLPSDLGDPLFVTWVMAWMTPHLTAAAGGDLAALGRMWHAPIFAPEPSTLAYSEAFLAQSLATLPVRWAGGSPIAAYDVAFMASFWLSALGAYVFVRALTNSRDAALVAGIVYGFNVYRLISLSHLHTLWGQWPAFVLAGALVFARSGSRAALAGAAVALVATAWSSLYYLAYFTPLVLAFSGVVLVRHDTWRRRGRLGALAIAVCFVAACILPFLWPYLEVQRALGVARAAAEVQMSSLTLDAYAAARWHLAPMLALTAVAVAAAQRPSMQRQRWAIGLFGLTALVAMWLSLGPTPLWRGTPTALPGLYGVLLDYVPGFSGLRVAARMAMVLMLALATLAGIGAAVLACRWPVAGRLVVGIAMAVHLGLYWTVPLPRDVPVGVGPLREVPEYLDPAAPPAPIYHAVAGLDPAAILVELPFGEPAYELRFMAAALYHGRRLVNGYSGVFPASYRARLPTLTAPWRDPDAAWAALAPATHALVHADAWAPAEAHSVQRWLAERGARQIAAENGAILWALPPGAGTGGR